jgi:uncharacterized protein (DUF934 family)
MQIIKDRQVINNSWSYITDDAELTTGDKVVSLARWQQDKQKLLDSGNCGIRITPADSLDDIIADLGKINLIELDFPEFADGRLFSKAWLLRARYQYQGEIRAIGNFMPDQVFYLARVGVNAFCPEKPEELSQVLACLNDFTVFYQSSIN